MSIGQERTSSADRFVWSKRLKKQEDGGELQMLLKKEDPDISLRWKNGGDKRWI